MKIRIAFTVNVPPARRAELVELANQRGYGYGDPSDRELLSRFFRDQGESVQWLEREDASEA